jgi:hypothetical protein
MSIEQALAENTAAILMLAALMKPPVEVAKPAVKPAVKAKPATLPSGVVSVEVPTYFFAEKNKTVYAIQPGEPLQILSGAVEITHDEFLAHKSRLAAEFPIEVSQEDLMSKVILLSKRGDGREHMTRIVAEMGVAKFSLLAPEQRAGALALVEAALAT